MVSTSTSSMQKRFKYDVFLSFRGEDTRKNFVDHLYHALKDKGIYTYKDDEKIKKGKRISDDLLKSIEDAKFYIIVFSKNYSSSSWCLDELVKIMECQKMNGHTAYPVFYDVEPTEVRKQSRAVGEAFANNENKEDAWKWREAMKEAADLAGWELKNTLDGHEAKFIKKIVQEISLELRSINFGFDEKLVGMETRVKDVISSLEIGIDELVVNVRMLGIKGMGGAGKTTTARAVFDHLSNDFEAKSFVGNEAISLFVVEVLGSFLCGKDKLEWVDAIDRLKRISPKRDPGKGYELNELNKIDPSTTPTDYGFMRRLKIYWLNDMGTEETRCLKLDMSRRNSRIVMKGLGKMKKLRYLEVNYADSDPEFDHTSQYFTNSLKYLNQDCVQLWDEVEKKVLQKLKFPLSLRVRIDDLDMRIIPPNPEEFSLDNYLRVKRT
ncbi:Toll/interleukin-1 receptor domain-containing protein [Tanacetum coccineum]